MMRRIFEKFLGFLLFSNILLDENENLSISGMLILINRGIIEKVYIALGLVKGLYWNQSKRSIQQFF